MFIGVKNQQSKSCPSCMLHTFLTQYVSLPKIIKLSQTVWDNSLNKILASVEIST